ncbi:MAG: hypothetical protein KAT34_15400 [Candidatus Aminicenantes bacterium]|jgi:hypothetical protein|nr:hypothetical protein [Candidatus Aminicenantes bacterium]
MERVVKTIRFPGDILEQMRPFMNKNRMNFTSFVIEAIKNYIRVLKYKEGIESSFGAWKKGDHPELAEGGDHYIRNMRRGRSI